MYVETVRNCGDTKGLILHIIILNENERSTNDCQPYTIHLI